MAAQQAWVYRRFVVRENYLFTTVTTEIAKHKSLFSYIAATCQSQTATVISTCLKKECRSGKHSINSQHSLAGFHWFYLLQLNVYCRNIVHEW